jgi:hypothetical protein
MRFSVLKLPVRVLLLHLRCVCISISKYNYFAASVAAVLVSSVVLPAAGKCIHLGVHCHSTLACVHSEHPRLHHAVALG